MALGAAVTAIALPLFESQPVLTSLRRLLSAIRENVSDRSVKGD
jgi:hypothetical protein